MADQTRHLLLVEDEAALREAVAEQLTDRGYHVEQADSGETAVERLADFAFDIIITDLRLPGIDGSAVVEAAVERYPDIIAIVITGYGTVKDAVEAIKRGARDFVSKPFQIDELLHVLDSALEQRRLRSENAYLRAHDSSAQPAATAAFRRVELQRDSRDPARSRALRSRARRVHRRGRQSAGTSRAGAQGHPVSRRSRDDERRAADEAAARAAGAGVRANRRHP